MLPWSATFAGRIDELELTSELLRPNPLGDPHVRPLWVYLPPGYDGRASRRYPSVYVLQGFTGQVTMWRNRTAYRQPFPETADGLFARQEAPPAIVVYVDAWTAYGGSQFVDSPGTGAYHSYLCQEVVPFVDARYRTLADPAHRAVMGKSSGGFGAMITPMLRPDLFGALASHAGDALYELCYIPIWPPQFAISGVRRRHLALVGRLQLSGRLCQGGRRQAFIPARRVCLLLGAPRWARGAPDRPGHRRAAPRGVATLARLGPGADGAALRRGPALAAGDLGRCRHPGRLLPRPWRRGVRGPRCGEQA